jgi:predicted PurR-regulated permease PerM
MEPTAPLEPSPAPSPPPAPPPLPAVATVAVVILAILATGAAVMQLGKILQPLLVALLIFYMIKPPADLLRRRLHFPNWLAYLSLFALVVVAVFFVVEFVSRHVAAFGAHWPSYETQLNALLERYGREGSTVSGLLHESAAEISKYVVATTLTLFELATLTFFYVLFLLLGTAKLEHRVRRALSGRRAEHILETAQKVNEGMERYVRVKSFVNFGLGFSSGLLVLFFGLDYWLLWACLFFVLNYITYLGSIVACVPPIVQAYLQLNPFVATVFAALLVFNRFAWIDYIEIRYSGQQLNLDSILLFLWLAFWGWAWGVIGLILAIPMLTTLKIILASNEKTAHWAVLMSEE